jgi:biopolymer transport protein ExbD
MRRFSQRHGLTTLSEINVTPLLDLAFVLLIIFLITTPLMEQSIDLIVPSSVAARSAVDPANVQSISVNRDQLIKLNDRPVEKDQLANRLLSLKQTRPEIAVVIRAHKDLPVQALIDIMDVVQQLEITKVGVTTIRETP